MKLSKLAGVAAVGVGAVAAANRGLRYDGELEPPLVGDRGTFRWRGMDVSYTEAGDPEDPDLVLFHGVSAAGSSGEYREVFGDLTADFHVIAPDLPGYGASDRPPLRYSAALYEDFVRDFLAEFDEPAVVTSSLSGAYVANVADHLDLSGIVAVCPTSTAGPEPPKTWLRELIRSPLAGEAIYNAATSKAAIRYFSADHGYYDVENIDEAYVDYQWKTSHVEGARFAPASFIGGFLNSEVDLAEAYADLDAPVTLVWGREAETTPLAEGRALADEADCGLVVFDRTRLLPHVEHPNRFLETVREGLDASTPVREREE